jgi:hypothetical protein
VNHVFNIKLSEASLSKVGYALSRLPYFEVAPVISEIEMQVKAQQQRAHEAAADRRDDEALQDRRNAKDVNHDATKGPRP